MGRAERRAARERRASRVKRWLCFGGLGDAGFHGKLVDTPKYCRHEMCKNRRASEGRTRGEKKALLREGDE